MVGSVDLIVEGAEVVEPADSEESAGEKPDQAGSPFAEVESVESEVAEKDQQEPREGVFIPSRGEPAVCVGDHSGDEEQVDDPTHPDEARGKKPNASGDGPSKVKAMHSYEAQNPGHVGDEFAVCGRFHKGERVVLSRGFCG